MAPPPKGSAARALAVLHEVARSGPMTPKLLTSRTGIDRTAVHRAIHVLIDEGLVRYQLGKRQVILTQAARSAFQGGKAMPGPLERAVSAVEDIARSCRVTCDIAVLNRPTGLRILETTDRDMVDDDSDAFFESDLAALLLTCLQPTDAVHVVNEVSEAFPGANLVEDRQYFIGRYQMAKRHGYLWDEGLRQLCVPLSLRGAQAMVIRLRPGTGGPQNLDQFQDVWAQLTKINPVLFPRPRQ